MKKILRFFDLLEDRVRARLSRHPLLYGIISGVGIVMFYRGLWMVMDGIPWMDGWTTLAIATALLMLSGVFVSQFVSNHIILSGIRREKKMVEKVGEVVKSDVETTREIAERLKRLEEEVRAAKR